jgi:hypothetical protein
VSGGAALHYFASITSFEALAGDDPSDVLEVFVYLYFV